MSGPSAQPNPRTVVVAVTVLALLIGLPVLPGSAAPGAGWPAAGTVATEPDRTGSAGSWRWPVAGPPRVLRSFDPPAQRWGRGHRGVDLPGSAGAPVRAVADGIVSYSGEIAGVGTVAVRHAGGLRSTYQPVADRIAAGDVVRAGDQLGTLVDGHCPLLTCLHLGAVSDSGAYHDPELLLHGWRVRLLPLRPSPGPAGPNVSWVMLQRR